MRQLLLIFVCAVTAMILSACASRLDADYGTSYKLAKINQVLYPDAERNLEPVYGLSGIAVQGVMDRYEAGFKEKSAAPAYTISVGGIGATQ